MSSSTSSVSEISEMSSSGDNIYVTGDGLVPDCSGVYCPNGSGGGKDMYQREDNKFMICWKNTFERWELIDFSTANCWHRCDENLFGEYEPIGNVEGYPIVSNTP